MLILYSPLNARTPARIPRPREHIIGDDVSSLG
jgi:hypothetical protein